MSDPMVQLVAMRSIADEALGRLVRAADARRAGDDALAQAETERAEDLLVAATAGPMCQACGCTVLLQCEEGCVGHETGRCSTCSAIPVVTITVETEPSLPSLTTAELAAAMRFPLDFFGEAPPSIFESADCKSYAKPAGLRVLDGGRS